jgi:hypothetical protein
VLHDFLIFAHIFLNFSITEIIQMSLGENHLNDECWFLCSLLIGQKNEWRNIFNVKVLMPVLKIRITEYICPEKIISLINILDWLSSIG